MLQAAMGPRQRGMTSDNIQLPAEISPTARATA
jgi:hypothetical protein